ncbi:MAG: hypothetical protein FWC40_02685 [Proteobacteria bacterium]|nr:hypothetical protein [Pseudomonadota bacterium]
MTKPSVALILLLGLAGLQGCNDTKDKTVWCTGSFHEVHCQNEKIVHCVVKEGSRAEMVESESYIWHGIKYVCSADDKLLAANHCNGNLILDTDGAAHATLCGINGTTSCRDGALFEDDNMACLGSSANVKCFQDKFFIAGDNNDWLPTSQRYICAASGKVGHCQGNTLVHSVGVCDGSGVISCRYNGYNGMSLVRKSCKPDTTTCIDFEKSGVSFAECFYTSGVQENCGDITTYGKCNQDVLVMCSKTDASKGKLLHIDCAVSQKSCLLIDSPDQDYGYDCAIVCEDPAGAHYTDFGACENNIVKFCSQTGEFDSIDCADTTCQWTTDVINNFFYDCRQ